MVVCLSNIVNGIEKNWNEKKRYVESVGENAICSVSRNRATDTITHLHREL